MTFSDDENNPPVTGMTDHTERYRRYLEKLKSGKSSGISSTFGRAEDLLDIVEAARPATKNAPPPQPRKMSILAQELQDSDNASRSQKQAAPTVTAQVGESAPPSAGRNDDVQSSSAGRAPISDKTGVTENGIGQIHVVGVFYDNDQPMLLMSDLTTMPAPTLDEVAANPPGAGASAFDELALDSSADQLASKSEPDLRVSAPDGMWLWDIFYDNDMPLAIETADGTLIQRTENETVFVMAEPTAGRRFPRLFVMENVAVDPLTGNIFWQALHSNRAGAFLNSGWQIEQNVGGAEGDTFFATKPMTFDNPIRERFQVYELEVDAIAGEVSFSTADGASVTLQSRKLG